MLPAPLLALASPVSIAIRLALAESPTKRIPAGPKARGPAELSSSFLTTRPEPGAAKAAQAVRAAPAIHFFMGKPPRCRECYHNEHRVRRRDVLNRGGTISGLFPVGGFGVWTDAGRPLHIRRVSGVADETTGGGTAKRRGAGHVSHLSA